MAKTYEVSVPIMGVAHLTVEADSEAEAIEMALGEAGPQDVDEWTAYEVVAEGNFYHGMINRARIDNVYDDGDE